MRSWRPALLLAVALAAIAALPGQTSADQNVAIDESEFKLQPMQLNVAAGEVVHFTIRNVGTIQHNLEVELESAGIEQKLFPTNLQPGEMRTADFTFPRAGTWEMYCPVGNHKDRGMTGEIMVAAAAPAAQATPAPTPARPAAATPAARPTPTPATPPMVRPTQLPRTGDAAWLPVTLSLAGLGLLGAGFLARRRW